MATSKSDMPEEPVASQSQNVDQRERQERIRERVIAEGFVRSEQLAEEFSVALMTIHRDLDTLQRQGWLRKIRGGATAQPSALFHGDIRYRMQAMREVKEELARTAIKIVTRGQAIMLDESTTVFPLARLLPERGPITVITYSLGLLKHLAGEPGIDLIALGGTYYPAYDAFLGLSTADSIRALRADMLIMSTTAITEEFCYHQSQETIIVKRALMEGAATRVLLVDHSKFSKRGLFQLAPLSDFDLIIVDKGIEARNLQSLQESGATVCIAGTESEDGQEIVDALNEVS